MCFAWFYSYSINKNAISSNQKKKEKRKKKKKRKEKIHSLKISNNTFIGAKTLVEEVVEIVFFL